MGICLLVDEHLTPVKPDVSQPCWLCSVSDISYWWRCRTGTRSSSTACWPLTLRSSCPSSTLLLWGWPASSMDWPSGDRGEALLILNVIKCAQQRLISTQQEKKNKIKCSTIWMKNQISTGSWCFRDESLTVVQKNMHKICWLPSANQ